MTFLLVSIGVSVANLELADQTGSNRARIAAGLVLMTATVGTLIYHLATHEPRKLLAVGLIYAVTAVLELFANKHARGATG